MKVILVDDELKSLVHLEEMLNNFDNVNIIGKFTNSLHAQKSILLKKPDVVFLDIQMPSINGIDLAKTIKQSLLKTHIVFTTAHDRYAIKAFELHAQDYILKPFNLIRLKNTMQRIPIPMESINELEGASTLPVICTFQSFRFSKKFNSDLSLNIKWRTSKVKGLFLFLLQHREKFLLKDSLLELFWPELNLKNGYTQLYSAIYHIRKILKSIDSDIMIVGFQNAYKLKLNKTKLDVDEWENWLGRLPYITRENIDVHRNILKLYQGNYLENEEYIWVENERERLKALWIGHVSKVAEYLASTEQVCESISLYLHLQASEPEIDISYYKLMMLYDVIGDMGAVESQYNSLREMLSIEYGLKPKDEITKWYEEWLETNLLL